MKTRDILSVVYGQGADGLQTRLADIADSLVAAHDEREARRMAEAEVRDQLAGYGPLLDQVQHALTAQQTEALTDSRLPAVMTFDAYCLMKDASKAEPSDRGLKQAAHLLYDRWTQDPTGHLTVGELVSFRDHFVDVFPKSAAKQVFDETIPNAGFNTLTDLPHLTRIATEVSDQESYERAMEFHGLDGDRPVQIRARAYIKAIAELALSDEPFQPMTAPTGQGAFERALDRVAQELFTEAEDDMPEDAVYAPGEEALPHDENTEEMTTVNSPVTGEPLVLELGIKDDQGVDGMEPSDEESSPETGPLPHSFDQDSRIAQQLPLELGQEAPPPVGTFRKLPSNLQRLMVLSHGKLVSSGNGTFVFQFHDENTAEIFAEQARGQVSGNRVIVKSAQQVITLDGDMPFNEMDSETDETMTMVVDPTSGEELQVILRHVTDEEPEMGEPHGEGESMLDKMDEMGSSEPMDQEGSVHTADSAIYRKTLPQTEYTKSKKHTHNVQPEFWQSQRGKNYMEDYIPSEEEQEDEARAQSRARTKRIKNMNKPKSKTAERGFDEATSVQVPTQQGPMTGNHSETDPHKFFSTGKKPKKGPKKAQKLSTDQVKAVCARMGLSAATIEEQLLDGVEIAAGMYALRIGDQDEVELRRLAQSNSTEGARIMRTASMVEFDGIVADFMALTAAQFAVEAPASAPRTAAKREVEKVGSFVLSSDVPQGAPINARRMMASIWKIVPDAEGELMDDGRLSVILRTAAQRDVNRIQRVLADVFGVAHIEAQMISPAPQPPQVSQDNANSPYQGQTPVNRQPAGAPMQPMQAPQQKPQTGSGAQQDFIARHTDPTKQAEGHEICGCGSKHAHAVHAQMAPPPQNAMPVDAIDDDLEMDVGGEEGGDGTEAGDLSELIQAAVDLGVPMDLAQAVVDSNPEEMGHRLRVKGLDDTAEEIRWRALHREAQLDDAEGLGDDELPGDEGGLSDLPLDEGPTPSDEMGEPGLGAPPTDPMMGGAPMPGMGGPMPGMGMDPMTLGAPQDASQMPIDMSQGQLQPEDEEAVRAAAMHFRNMGMLPLESIGKFSSAYSALLDKYGDQNSPQRALADAAIVRAIMEAFSKPAVVPVKQGSKQAEMPHPKPTVQHPGKVTVSEDWTKGEVPVPGTPPAQQGSPVGTFSNKKMHGKPTSHAWGGDKKPGGPQKGSRAKQPGTAHPSTDIVPGTDGSENGSIGNKMDSLSKSAPGTVRSTSKGKKADLIITFDPELGDFHLARDEKRLAIHASLNEALADAERRRLGTEARILIDDGQGGFDEA